MTHPEKLSFCSGGNLKYSFNIKLQQVAVKSGNLSDMITSFSIFSLRSKFGIIRL